MDKEIQALVEKFLEKPYFLDMGKGLLSRLFNAPIESIREAKVLARQKRKSIQMLSDLPKILLLDIETAPMAAWVWGRWKQNIHLEQTMAEWFILTWSAKWFLSADILSEKLTPSEVINQDDKRIMRPLWDLINDADIIIGHNCDVFDIPKINSRFLLNGFPPPSPYRTIDTKLISAKQFGFSSNKLDALAEYFGFDKKLPTAMELWTRCMKGDLEALKYMEIYNRKDVQVLEEVYIKLRPWMKSHPNSGMYTEDDVTTCSACGSKDVSLMEDRFYYTQVGKYPVYRCANCGAVSRGRKTTIDREKNKKMVTSIPR